MFEKNFTIVDVCTVGARVGGGLMVGTAVGNGVGGMMK
jgi:hypothetical protein